MCIDERKKTVLIMMATYNSAKYIQQQIDSIVRQTYSNWRLIVQDDGSTDETISILNKNTIKDSRICVNYNDSGMHGAYINFHWLIQKMKKRENFDYYMFSDHDDIWDDNKIEQMLDLFNSDKALQENPALIYGDMRIIDDTGKTTLNSLNSRIGIEFKNNVSTFFSHNVYGCNTMFNKLLMDKVPSLNFDDYEIKFLSHDNFMAKLAATFGKIKYMAKPLMSYRRYSSNVTANQSYSFGISRIVTRIVDVQKLAKDHALTYKQSLYEIKILKKMVTPKEYQFLTEIEKVLENGGWKSIIFLKKKKISWGKRVKTLSRSIILLSGCYKKYL